MKKHPKDEAKRLLWSGFFFLFFFAGTDLSIEPDSLVALWVDVVRVHAQVAEFPPQAFGLNLLKRRFANEVSGLKEQMQTLFFF